MKFTSVAVLALFLADTSAVLLQKEAKKDCGDVGCERHLSYAFDQPTLDKAEAHNVAANHHFAGATAAAAAAADAMAAATQKALIPLLLMPLLVLPRLEPPLPSL